MIYVLGVALGVSVVYGVMKSLEVKERYKEIESYKLLTDSKGKRITDLKGEVEYYKKKLELNKNVLQRANVALDSDSDRIKNLETKVSDLKEQLKLEDEASCRIIKELEEMVAELERENKLKDDKIAYEIGEKKNYIGYIDYVINAPRAVRRKFANGEKVDWIDENGVLRMRMVEEK